MSLSSASSKRVAFIYGVVTPAQAGVHGAEKMDSRLRGNDAMRTGVGWIPDRKDRRRKPPVFGQS
jgi:hypothetical protein